MSNARLLYRLQQVDQEIESTQKALSELKVKLGESGVLQQARSAADEAHRRLNRAETTLKDGELELQTVTTKLSSSQESLYSGRVSNPKELQSLEQELVRLTRRRDQMQDTVLERMVEVDEARQALKDAQAALAGAERGWEAEHGQMQHGLEQAGARLEHLGRERGELEKRLGPQDVKLYDDLRQRKGPAPVARLRGGRRASAPCISASLSSLLLGCTILQSSP